MKIHQFLAISLLLSSATLSSQAHDWTGARPDGHAPIGVMGEHTHGQGEWMVSYRYMHMQMEGNRNGTDQLSIPEVHGQPYGIAPEDMTMDMHMVGIMYAPIDRITLMAMVPYTFLSMDHIIAANGARFTTKSDGIGDAKFGGLVQLGQWNEHRAHLNLGFSAPTGSTDERDFTPAGGANSPLPYPMQLGSGTWDLLPGITYLGQTENWSWGGQFLATLRLGRNDEDYSLGDKYNLTGWVARKICKNASVSFRLDGQTWKNVDGEDNRLNPMMKNMIPTADPSLRGGTRLDALLGLNIQLTEGFTKGHRIAIEGGLPVYQYLEGPQLETDWLITAGWQYAW